MKIDIRVTESDFKEALVKLSKSKRIAVFLIDALFVIIGGILILLNLLNKTKDLIDGIIFLCIALIILFSELSYDRYNKTNQINLFKKRSNNNHIDYYIEFDDEIRVLNKNSNNKEVFQYNEIINVIESKNIFVIQMNFNIIQIITKRELSNNQINEIVKIFEDKNIKLKIVK